MKPQMVIDGVAYVERTAPSLEAVGRLTCGGCAFNRTDCNFAVEPSIKAFGGGCTMRRVIYIRADADQHPAIAELLKARDAINAAIAALEAA